jgi:hypothetical protein
VLRIRDVYPGSKFFHPGSRVTKIPDPGSASKNLSVFNPKIFLSSRKYDPGCSSRIPDPDLDFFTLLGSRGHKGNGSRIRIPNTAALYSSPGQLFSCDYLTYMFLDGSLSELSEDYFLIKIIF